MVVKFVAEGYWALADLIRKARRKDISMIAESS